MEAIGEQLKRNANWSDAELLALAESVKDSLHVIKGKYSPFITNSTKRGAWESVVERVNAVSPTDKRSVEQCKKKWISIVAIVKKKEAGRRAEAGGTGGGRPPVNLPLWQEIVLSTIPRCTVAGIDGGVDSAAEIRDDAVMRDVEDEQKHPVIYEDGSNASIMEKAAVCDTSLTNVVRSASGNVSEKQHTCKPVACGQSLLHKSQNTGAGSSRTSVVRSASGNVSEKQHTCKPVACGQSLLHKSQNTGAGSSRTSAVEVDQSERFLEIELKKLKHAEEALQIKKQKNVILQETLECNKRTAEALETIAYIMKQQDITDSFFEN